MKKILLLVILPLVTVSLPAQNIYLIKGDSVKITNCDSAELILENHTQAVKGFLYNTGNGRTLFKKGLVKLNSSSYIIGADTLNLGGSGWLQGGNSFGATGVLGTLDNNHLDLYSNNTQQARLTSTGNFLIGTTTDSSYKLQLQGSGGMLNMTQSLTGSTALPAINLYAKWRTSGIPTAFRLNVQDSALNASSNLMEVIENGITRFKLPANGPRVIFNSFGLQLQTNGNTPGGISLNGSGANNNSLIVSSNFNLGATTGITSASDALLFSSAVITHTTGTVNLIRTSASFVPTSGSGVFNMLNLASGINQTGGASAITRGLYVNPNIINATDFRAIEVATGKSVFNGAVNITGDNGYSQLRLVTHYTPTSSSDTNGAAGDTAVDDNYFYYKTSTGWKRAALTTF